MLNLNKKIKELQESTSSLEAKSICKEFLENFSNLTDSQVSTAIVEKIKTVNDADKAVKRFVSIAEKVEAINNLGVARGIATIKETSLYTYPALKYGLDKIEQSLINTQVRVVENESPYKEHKPGDIWTTAKVNEGFTIQRTNAAGKPEYLLIDQMIESIKSFVWDPTVEKVHSGLKEKRETLRESIDIAISVANMSGAKGSFFFDSIMPKLEEHFINPTENSRATLIESLSKLNFYPAAKNLSESLSKIQKSATKGVQIISDNTRCTVSSIYSPVLLENGSEYFFVKGNFYTKKGDAISQIEESSVTALPEKFRELCRIVSSPNVFIKEGKISFYMKRNKVEIFENEGKIQVHFNGNKVANNELAKNMVSAGLFRLDESRVAYDVQLVTEAFNNIYDLDFGKIIESKAHQGSYVILMKSGDNISLSKVNESVKTNEFYSGLKATQARNIILEFIGFDIKESMDEYLEKDETKLKEMREAQLEILKNIAIVEANIEKVNTVMNDSFMSSTEEMKTLKDMLESEMAKLREDHRNISSSIKAYENKTTSDVGFDIGDEVKLTDSGDSATITAINSSRDTVTVVTAKGTTKEVPTSKVASLEANIAKAEVKNENEETEDLKKKL
jgi:hypothetical protein